MVRLPGGLSRRTTAGRMGPWCVRPVWVGMAEMAMGRAQRQGLGEGDDAGGGGGLGGDDGGCGASVSVGMVVMMAGDGERVLVWGLGDQHGEEGESTGLV